MKWFMPIAQKKLRRGAKLVDVEAGRKARPDVLEAVGQRVPEFDVGRRPRLLHVVAADRDAVEARHPLGAVAEDVADDPHRGRRAVDVGVADHELLQDVVLDRPRELRGRHALLLGRDDVEGHDRQHGPVHGHRHGHLVERDPVEENLHVLDRCRWPRPPCRRRPPRARCRSRSRDASRGRRRPTGPSAPPRGCGGRTRWIPRPSRIPRTAGSSRAATRTSWSTARAGTAGRRRRTPDARAPRGRRPCSTASPRSARRSASQGLRPSACRLPEASGSP